MKLKFNYYLFKNHFLVLGLFKRLLRRKTIQKLTIAVSIFEAERGFRVVRVTQIRHDVIGLGGPVGDVCVHESGDDHEHYDDAVDVSARLSDHAALLRPQNRYN